MTWPRVLDWTTLRHFLEWTIIVAAAVVLVAVERTRQLFNRCYDTGLRVVQFPVYMFDLVDRQGKPDHGKIVPFIVVMTWNFGLVSTMILKREWPPVVLVIGVMSLSFLSANLFRYFLKRGQWRTNDGRRVTDTHTVVEKTIAEARLPETGEPSILDPLQAPHP